jgi:hypothetical protein
MVRLTNESIGDFTSRKHQKHTFNVLLDTFTPRLQLSQFLIEKMAQRYISIRCNDQVGLLDKFELMIIKAKNWRTMLMSHSCSYFWRWSFLPLAIQPANPLDYKHNIAMRCCVDTQQQNLESRRQSIHAWKNVVAYQLIGNFRSHATNPDRTGQMEEGRQVPGTVVESWSAPLNSTHRLSFTAPVFRRREWQEEEATPRFA